MILKLFYVYLKMDTVKTQLDDFPIHNRGGQGVISIKTSEEMVKWLLQL